MKANNKTKLLKATYLESYKIEFIFSDGKVNVFDYESTVLRGHEECKPYIDLENFKKFNILGDRKTIAWGENWDMILPFETIYNKHAAKYKEFKIEPGSELDLIMKNLNID